MPRIMHFNMPVNDLDRATTFYGKVFGWTYQKADGPAPYLIATTGPDEEPGINGTIYLRDANGQPEGICNVIDVPSVDEAVASIAAAGGTIGMGKMQIGEIGWIAVAADTEGNVFTILESARPAA